MPAATPLSDEHERSRENSGEQPSLGRAECRAQSDLLRPARDADRHQREDSRRRHEQAQTDDRRDRDGQDQLRQVLPPRELVEGLHVIQAQCEIELERDGT